MAPSEMTALVAMVSGIILVPPLCVVAMEFAQHRRRARALGATWVHLMRLKQWQQAAELRTEAAKVGVDVVKEAST